MTLYRFTFRLDSPLASHVVDVERAGARICAARQEARLEVRQRIVRGILPDGVWRLVAQGVVQ